MKHIIALALVLTSSLVQAENVGYVVEVIIFEDKTGIYNYSEQWNAIKEEKTEEPVGSKVKSKKKTRVDKEFSILKDDNSYRLSGQVKKLAKHPDFNVLVHKMWKQTGLDRNDAFAVHVDSRDYSGTAKTSKHTEPLVVNGSSTRISGELKLIMSRYLHINTDLVYEKPSSEQSVLISNQSEYEPETNFQTFPLKFERRMRSREIHYIDHPMVGIIVLATPFKIGGEEKAKPAEYKTI